MINGSAKEDGISEREFSGHSGRRPHWSGQARMLRETKPKVIMEAFVLALIAVRKLYRQQDAVKPEVEFQRFDLRELTPLYSSGDKSSDRRSDRAASFVPQAAS
jgi:hypothetical protein